MKNHSLGEYTTSDTALLWERPYLRIHRSPEQSWLHADWVGYQTVGSVQEGCNAILDLMIREAAYNILNDNTHVMGIWSGAATWVAQDWFPRMRAQGMQRFAWVYSPTRFSRISTDTTLAELGETAPYIAVFEEILDAVHWLEELDARARKLKEWMSKAVQYGAPKAVIATVISNDWNPIRAWREHRHMSQGFVASRLGLSQVEYAAREAVSGSPAESEVHMLSLILSVPPDLLVVEDANPPAENA